MKTPRTVVAAIAALFAFLRTAAQTPAAPVSAQVLRTRAEAAFSAPQMLSSDGFVKVRSFAGDSGFCGPVLQAASEVVEAVSTGLKIQPPAGEPGLVIFIRKDGTPGDTSVLEYVVPTLSGRVSTRVVLPCADSCSLRHFRRACAAALLRAWVDSVRDANVKGPLPEVPDWAVEGLLRSCGRRFAARDAAVAAELWRSGDFPPVWRIFPKMRLMESERGTALCGFFAEWMRDTPADSILPPGAAKDSSVREKIDVFRLQLERLSRGMPWNPQLVLRDLSGSQDPSLQDAALDERMIRNTRAWLTPGKLQTWDVDAFASRLCLAAPFSLDGFSDGSRVCSFRRAIPLGAHDPAVRFVAARKIYQVRLLSSGRGDALSSAGEMYARFLSALAANETPRETLEEMLDAAEAKLAEAKESAIEGARNPE